MLNSSSLKLLFVGFLSFGLQTLPVVSSRSSFSGTKLIDLGFGYVVGEDPVPHATAKSLCDFAGKELVSIESMEEDKLILSLLRNAGFDTYVWTSGTNAAYDKKVYRWGNGEALFYTRWYPSTPRYDTTYCMYLELDQADRVWGTTHCTNDILRPLCENKKFSYLK